MSGQVTSRQRPTSCGWITARKWRASGTKLDLDYATLTSGKSKHLPHTLQFTELNLVVFPLPHWVFFVAIFTETPSPVLWISYSRVLDSMYDVHTGIRTGHHVEQGSTYSNCFSGEYLNIYILSSYHFLIISVELNVTQTSLRLCFVSIILNVTCLIWLCVLVSFKTGAPKGI